MQANYGSTGFNSSHADDSILAMIQQGAQGTTTGGPKNTGGPGLVGFMSGMKWGVVDNPHPGNPFVAARRYNSGSANENLDDNCFQGKPSATQAYANDIANRLLGWQNAGDGSFKTCGYPATVSCPFVSLGSTGGGLSAGGNFSAGD